LKAINIPTC